jgi:hypothetical protein
VFVDLRLWGSIWRVGYGYDMVLGLLACSLRVIGGINIFKFL